MAIKIGGRTLAVVGVVAALAIAAGVVALNRGGDARPDPTKTALPDGALAEQWRSADLSGWGDTDSVLRMWATDGPVVAVTTAGVWGFEAKTGKRRWKLQPPATSGAPCEAASTPNNHGTAAVLYGSGAERCGKDLVVFDTHSGDVLWHKRVRAGEGSDPPRVSIGDKAVTVDSGEERGGTHLRYSVDGDKLSLPAIPKGRNCPDKTRWVQSPTYTLAESLCADQLFAFDTQSGKHRWTRSLDGTHIPGTIVADSPLSVASYVGDGKGLTTFTDKGKLQADIDLPGAISDRPHLIDDSVLVTQVDGDDARFVAVNLKNGDEVWRNSSLIDGMAVGADDDQLLVLASIDARSKKHMPDGYDCQLVGLNRLNNEESDEGILPCAGVSSTIHDVVATDKIVYVLADAREKDSAVRLTAYKRPR